MTEPVGRDELTPVDLQVALVDSINDLAPYTLRGIGMRKAKPGAQQPAAEVDVLPFRSKRWKVENGSGVRMPPVRLCAISRPSPSCGGRSAVAS
ncbi:hypothetical protein LPC10_08410 [Methylorubrum sp. B1-46]|uniref:hypothetical protein n=1 Tax=Methylorubrum sp. B1-46 TaxID=2897334 RepID=UPI001E58357E|nr:hypothetical protein [Methylorubrum sp. B1-46]UGB27571.1 hypothetical protein LPC10_08410 [Methylorubrum sp. B1-46]